MPLLSTALLLSLTLLAAPAPPKAPASDPVPKTSSDATPAPLAAPAAAPEAFTDPLILALTPAPGGLTADDVARYALRSAPSIGVRTAELQQAAARVDLTMINYLPQLQGAAAYSRLSKVNVDFGGGGSSVGTANAGPLVIGTCPGGQGQCVLDSMGVPAIAAPFAFVFPLNSYSLSAALSVPLSDYILSLVPARRSSQAGVEAARLARAAEVIKVEADARIAYYNWLRTIAAVVVADTSAQRSKARLLDAEAAFEAGVASQADVLRLDALVASTESAVVQAAAARDLAASHLALMMARGDATFAVGEDVLTPPSAAAPLRALPQLIDEAHAQRLELRSLGQHGRALDEGRRIYRAGYLPRLDAFADATYANPNQRFFPLSEEWNASWSAGARISYSLGQAMLARARLRENRADIHRLDQQAEQLRRGIAMEVTSAYLDRQRALATIELNARAVRSSEEAYRVATELFQAGTATTTDIIEAELARVSATLQEVNARIDLRVAELRLLYATGRLAPIEDPA
jgi:outer membrane protein